MWVKEVTRLQQPTVQFKHIALLAVEGTAPGATQRHLPHENKKLSARTEARAHC